ncbi:hypothetical protein [Candidatus Nitrosopumilus sediminis]|uniref:Uncharacterized protein n=1 Tax=Candidatus Nitrosopumilus sediminis TaxID=1229909 RepID=K0BFB2_9ARCH|nr:hypothetical protein [Candidatus Nitrosopumilus sediminis]AFS83762.1 hypothetical protein NSED_09880 [Candidatus Nitrosopumilus sediminis]
MKYLFAIILLTGIFISPAFAQETNNPSLIIDTLEIPSDEFNTIVREAPIRVLDDVHAVSWQVTIDNNLLYANPNGNAVLRLYDQENRDEFIEVGMGSQPDNKFWVAVQTPKEGYIVVHRDLDRGWYPEAKSIISFTDRAGLTVNNGARIVVTNLDIGEFAIHSYSVHGMEGSTDPPAVSSGSMIIEFLSGDPAKNVFALFPFYVAAGMGVIVGILFLTKKRS